MAILVAGGAGYIGSHNVRALLEAGREAIVIDSLRTGHREALPARVKLFHADLRDSSSLDAVFESGQIDAVLHFAASSLVAESMSQPLAYFDNNVGGMLSLLQAMQRHGVKNIVFSSSAAVYGGSAEEPIPENAALAPGNPYGESKLAMERFMRWAALTHGMSFVILRYFNVAGAWPGGLIGEDHRPESHLVPLILQVPLGLRGKIRVFGTDYPTRDGSCIRDYVDIMDLVDAHMRALAHLERGGDSLICNLGSERGFSVLQVIEAAREVTGHAIPTVMAGRRPGDPAMLVASSSLAREVLGWKARKSIEEIIESAWQWHRTHPRGYGNYRCSR